MAVEGEGDALGLDDVERFESVADGSVVAAVVEVDGGWRGRRAWFFEHFEYAPFDQVDDGDDAFDGSSVAVVVFVVAEVGDAFEDAVFGFPEGAEVAGRPGVDLDGVELVFGEAASGHGVAPGGVLSDDFLCFAEFLHQGEGLDAVHGCPGFDLGAVEVDDGFDGVAGGGVEHHEEGASCDGVAVGEVADGVFVGFAEGDEWEAPSVAGLVGRGDFGGGGDFVGGEWVEGVGGGGGGGWGLGGHGVGLRV